MIYTVTLNPASDKTAAIPGFTAGRMNRITTLPAVSARLRFSPRSIPVLLIMEGLSIRPLIIGSTAI